MLIRDTKSYDKHLHTKTQPGDVKELLSLIPKPRKIEQQSISSSEIFYANPALVAISYFVSLFVIFHQETRSKVVHLTKQ